jgi:hypothetical protein
MADTRTRSSGSIKWIGVIAALVTASVLVFHFTRPAPAKGVIAPTELDGFVADGTSRQLLRNSLVTVSLGGYSAQQRTDTFGRYSVVFPSPNANTSMATVQIEAAGYRLSENNVPLHPGNNFAEIMVNANPNASPAQVSPQTFSGSTPELRQVSASSEHHQVPPGKAEIVLKSLPSDFMKAPKTYAVAAKK